MSKTMKTKIVKVFFHVGAYIGSSVESGAAPGLKGVQSVEFTTISEGIKGVLIKSLKGSRSATNFVPVTNITSAEVVLEAEEPAAKK